MGKKDPTLVDVLDKVEVRETCRRSCLHNWFEVRGRMSEIRLLRCVSVLNLAVGNQKAFADQYRLFVYVGVCGLCRVATLGNKDEFVGGKLEHVLLQGISCPSMMIPGKRLLPSV